MINWGKTNFYILNKGREFSDFLKVGTKTTHVDNLNTSIKKHHTSSTGATLWQFINWFSTQRHQMSPLKYVQSTVQPVQPLKLLIHSLFCHVFFTLYDNLGSDYLALKALLPQISGKKTVKLPFQRPLTRALTRNYIYNVMSAYHREFIL